MANNVLIYAEQIGGKFRTAAYEAVCQGKKMAQELGGQAIAVGIGSGIAEAAKDLGHYGADKVMVVDSDKLKDFTVDAYGKAFAEVAGKNDPAQLLFSGFLLVNSYGSAFFNSFIKFHGSLSSDINICGNDQCTSL